MESTPTYPALDLLRSSRRVGVALSGGSARCAFQIGVLEALQELGEQHPATQVRGDLGAVAALLNRLLTTRLLAAARRRRSPVS